MPEGFRKAGVRLVDQILGRRHLGLVERPHGRQQRDLADIRHARHLLHFLGRGHVVVHQLEHEADKTRQRQAQHEAKRKIEVGVGEARRARHRRIAVHDRVGFRDAVELVGLLEAVVELFEQGPRRQCIAFQGRLFDAGAIVLRQLALGPAEAVLQAIDPLACNHHLLIEGGRDPLQFGVDLAFVVLLLGEHLLVLGVFDIVATHHVRLAGRESALCCAQVRDRLRALRFGNRVDPSTGPHLGVEVAQAGRLGGVIRLGSRQLRVGLANGLLRQRVAARPQQAGRSPVRFDLAFGIAQLFAQLTNPRIKPFLRPARRLEFRIELVVEIDLCQRVRQRRRHFGIMAVGADLDDEGRSQPVDVDRVAHSGNDAIKLSALGVSRIGRLGRRSVAFAERQQTFDEGFRPRHEVGESAGLCLGVVELRIVDQVETRHHFLDQRPAAQDFSFRVHNPRIRRHAGNDGADIDDLLVARVDDHPRRRRIRRLQLERVDRHERKRQREHGEHDTQAPAHSANDTLDGDDVFPFPARSRHHASSARVTRRHI